MRNIVIGKLVDKTIDADFEDLSELLFGEGNCFNSSEVRKRMYGMKAMIEAIERDGEDLIFDESAIDALEAKKAELQKERQRFYDQRREYNKLINKAGRIEYIEERLIDAANSLGESIGRVAFVPRNYDLSDSEAVVVLSDWHYGMTTDNLWNKYNIDICKERVSKVIGEAIKRIRLHRCRKVHIVILGDMLHGCIHSTARVASDEMTCDQLMQVSELLAQAIETIAAYADETIVYSTYGNHARSIQQAKDSIHSDNMERIIPWWLTERLKIYDNVRIYPVDDKEIIHFEGCGFGFLATHGDLDRVKTSPRLLTTLYQKKYGKDIHYILLGDKHHRETFEEMGVTAMICSSLCGTDEYANSKRLYSSPEQLLLILTPETGVDAEYHLKCE